MINTKQFGQFEMRGSAKKITDFKILIEANLILCNSWVTF